MFSATRVAPKVAALSQNLRRAAAHPAAGRRGVGPVPRRRSGARRCRRARRRRTRSWPAPPRSAGRRCSRRQALGRRSETRGSSQRGAAGAARTISGCPSGRGRQPPWGEGYGAVASASRWGLAPSRFGSASGPVEDLRGVSPAAWRHPAESVRAQHCPASPCTARERRSAPQMPRPPRPGSLVGRWK